MHQTSQSSSEPVLTAPMRLASLIQTASVYQSPLTLTAGMRMGSEMPATRRSRLSWDLETTSAVLWLKLQTLKVPDMPEEELMAPTSMPRWGKTSLRMPSELVIPGMSHAWRYSSRGMGAPNFCTLRVRQRLHISLGERPERSIARFMVPPDVPSPCTNLRPSSARARRTPAW